MLFLLSIRENFAVLLVVNMFEQAVELSDAYPPGAPVHPPKEYRVNSTASNFYRVASTIGVYLPALNQSEHVVIPIDKSRTQQTLLRIPPPELRLHQASSLIHLLRRFWQRHPVGYLLEIQVFAITVIPSGLAIIKPVAIYADLSVGDVWWVVVFKVSS